MRTKALSPEISVVMTMRNEERFLAEAIESVRSQATQWTWELILVDDGSEDRSFEIADTYARRYPGSIRLFTHDRHRNRGISASRNLGIRHANAPLLALLDADDVWLPFRLEHHRRLLATMPHVTMLYSQAERWFDPSLPFTGSDQGANFIPPLIPAGEHHGLLTPPTLLRWFLADESLTPCTCCITVRTGTVRKYGAFENTFRGLYDDQVLYAKLALHEPIFADPTCVARYRRHGDSCCSKADAGETKQDERASFLAWLDEYACQETQHGRPRTTNDTPVAAEERVLSMA